MVKEISIDECDSAIRWEASRGLGHDRGATGYPQVGGGVSEGKVVAEGNFLEVCAMNAWYEDDTIVKVESGTGGGSFTRYDLHPTIPGDRDWYFLGDIIDISPDPPVWQFFLDLPCPRYESNLPIHWEPGPGPFQDYLNWDYNSAKKLHVLLEGMLVTFAWKSESAADYWPIGSTSVDVWLMANGAIVDYKHYWYVPYQEFGNGEVYDNRHVQVSKSGGTITFTYRVRDNWDMLPYEVSMSANVGNAGLIGIRCDQGIMPDETVGGWNHDHSFSGSIWYTQKHGPEYLRATYWVPTPIAGATKLRIKAYVEHSVLIDVGIGFNTWDEYIFPTVFSYTGWNDYWEYDIDISRLPLVLRRNGIKYLSLNINFDNAFNANADLWHVTPLSPDLFIGVDYIKAICQGFGDAYII